MENFSSLTSYDLVSFSVDHQDEAIYKQTDQLLILTLKSLKDYPADKWIALCEALEPSAILVAAASYCAGFSWGNIRTTISRLGEIGEPLDSASLAAQYINPKAYQLIFQNEVIQFSEIARTQLPLSTIKFLMSGINTLDYDVSEQQLESLNPSIIKIVAWDWIKRGVPIGYENILKRWRSKHRENDELCFWLQFVIGLRSKHHQLDVSNLRLLARSQRQKILVDDFDEAVKLGPFKPQEASFLLNSFQLSKPSVLWQHFLRLAYWLPDQAPLVIPTPPIARYENDIHLLKQFIEQLS
jgi:hypothetical protein